MFEPLLAAIENRAKQFVVYRSGEETAVESQFAAHNVTIETRALPANGPDPFLAILDAGQFAGAIGVAELEALLEPPIVRPGEREEISVGYRALFDLLDEKVFYSLERSQLLAVAREIEDRAVRTGTGTLHVGFQTLSTFRTQASLYEHLAARSGLDIHIYGSDDWSPPTIPGISYHEYPDPSGERYWVLAFDGGANPLRACGLVAKERADGYDGFWTDDRELVESIATRLQGE